MQKNASKGVSGEMPHGRMRMPAESKVTQRRRAESLLTQDWRGSNEKRNGTKLESVELTV